MITVDVRSARRLALSVLATVLAAPGPLAAQEPLGEPAGERRNCLCFDRPMSIRGIQPVAFQRSRIGVMLGETDRTGPRPGVRVQEVTAGGPAERAGVRAGDVIHSLRGEALGDEPGTRLRAALGETEPGDTVAVGLRRDGRDVTLRVVTERADPFTIAFGGGPGVRAVAPFARAEAIRGVLAPALRGADRLQLVNLNEGLGRYFGTTEGVLVADVAADNRFGLRAGDVVLRVDGRAARDATHLRSMLASYRTDEAAAIDVMRDRRTVTVRGNAGDR